MSDRPEWFAPKRYGLGAGLPISLAGLGRSLRASSRSLAWRSALFGEDEPLIGLAIVMPTIALSC